MKEPFNEGSFFIAQNIILPILGRKMLNIYFPDINKPISIIYIQKRITPGNLFLLQKSSSLAVGI
jgi:hypothetical protein